MKAFVMTEIGRVGFMDKPVPRPGPNDAIVKTTRALICTSDSHTVHGGIGPRKNLTLADATFQDAIKITKPGGTVSNIGYFGEGEFVHIPRAEWGVGMADKTIETGLCPGGRLRMERLLRVLESWRLDPTLMTTHTFSFDDMEQAFEVSDKKLDDVIKPLITF